MDQIGTFVEEFKELIELPKRRKIQAINVHQDSKTLLQYRQPFQIGNGSMKQMGQNLNVFG